MDCLNQTNTPCTTSPVELYVLPVLYSLFFIVSFPANCLSLYVAWRLTMKGNSMAVYLVSLSVSDLLYTISLPVWIELARQKDVGEGLCAVVNLIMYNSFYVGSGLLCCISVDRYLAVVYPLYFHRIREVRTAVIVNNAVWILEIIIHILLLYHMGALKDSELLCELRTPMANEDVLVALTRIVLGFLVPAFIMTSCYHTIMRSLKQSTSIHTEERRKVGFLLLFLLLTYLVAFVPYQIVMFLKAILEPMESTWAKKLQDPYLVTLATTTLNSTLDPIIYCLISESAKREIRNVVRTWKRFFIRRNSSKESNIIQTIS